MSRPIGHDGTVFRRKGTKFLWMRYRERDGTLRRESTFADDWQEAQKKLRERLLARDGNILQIVRQGESLLFGKWTEFFMENYSKPPFRTIKTHVANLRAVKHLNRTFATRTLASLTADDIELYLRDRLRQRIRREGSPPRRFPRVVGRRGTRALRAEPRPDPHPDAELLVVGDEPRTRGEVTKEG